MSFYQCVKCHHLHETESPTPITCHKCGSFYLEWLDYEENTLELVCYPNVSLRTKCVDVRDDEFGSELTSFCSHMLNVMRTSRGLGLAANQVGHTRRIVVMKNGDKYMALINPKITQKTGGITKEKEGCLSFPGLFEIIDRHKSVTVEYFDTYGLKKTEDFHNIESICIQHEIDHLDGLTFLDRMSRLKKQIALKKMSRPWR